jgi:hypothetical protein
VALSGSFVSRIRRLQRHHPISLGYNHWILFLTFVVLERVLYCFFAVTTSWSGHFAGIELYLFRERFTARDAEDLRSGKAIGDESTELFVDPSVHYVHIWKILPDGTISVNDGELDVEQSLDILCSLASENEAIGGFILIEPRSNCRYAEVVSTLELARRSTAYEVAWKHGTFMSKIPCAEVVFVSPVGQGDNA